MLEANLKIDKITTLTSEYLVVNGIKAVLVDVDNTVIDPETKRLISGIKSWKKEMDVNNIIILFVSNTHSKQKKRYLEQELETRVIIGAIKPIPYGIRKALVGLDKIGIEKDEVAIVGDQTFTDVLGGNVLKLHTIKVDPISTTKEDSIVSQFCRFLENIYESRKDSKGREYVKGKLAKVLDNS